MKILCLDIEGGFGGSSRSLFHSLVNMPTGIEAEVWCRKVGPAAEWYAAAGVPVSIDPGIPNITALPRLSRNLHAFSSFAFAWRKGRIFRRKLLEEICRFDAIHLNHEGLFFLARWLRRRSEIPISMHVRNFLPVNTFSRWQYRTAARHVDAMVFITENEERRVRELVGRRVEGHVIYNVSAPRRRQRVENECANSTFCVGVLANYDWVRGIDRLVDVAAELKRRGRDDIRFLFAGDMTLRGRLPGKLGAIARQGGSLADYAAACGVAAQCEFLGHVSDPNLVLDRAHLLAKPTREDNPWGRDIIEALGAGLPVLSVGAYDHFVETDVTGVLMPRFTVATCANSIEALADDPDKVQSMGEKGAARVAQLCDGPARAKDLADVWRMMTSKSAK